MSIFNLSLDDQSPHVNAGLDFEAIGRCSKLIQRWPCLKIDLFVPAAYMRLGGQPHFLTQHIDWVKRMNDLPDSNYRICYHGYYHARQSIKYSASNNDEFQYLNELEARMVSEHMVKEFEMAGLKHCHTFRAPGWKLSASSAKVLTDMGFVIAGNQEYHDLLKDKVPSMRYITSNWDMNDECRLTGDVLAFGHTSNWCSNFLNEKVYDRVVQVLESREFEFRFLEDA
jgi:hypothetical protein